MLASTGRASCSLPAGRSAEGRTAVIPAAAARPPKSRRLSSMPVPFSLPAARPASGSAKTSGSSAARGMPTASANCSAVRMSNMPSRSRARNSLERRRSSRQSRQGPAATGRTPPARSPGLPGMFTCARAWRSSGESNSHSGRDVISRDAFMQVGHNGSPRRASTPRAACRAGQDCRHVSPPSRSLITRRDLKPEMRRVAAVALPRSAHRPLADCSCRVIAPRSPQRHRHRPSSPTTRADQRAGPFRVAHQRPPLDSHGCQPGKSRSMRDSSSATSAVSACHDLSSETSARRRIGLSHLTNWLKPHTLCAQYSTEPLTGSSLFA